MNREYTRLEQSVKSEKRIYEGLTAEEIWTVKAIKESLTGEVKDCPGELDLDAAEELKLLRAHSLTPLVESQLLGLLEKQNNPKNEEIIRSLRQESGQRTVHAMQQIYLTKKLVDAFEAAGIKIAVLKGISTARYYGKPEKRKAGDVDLLLLELDKLSEAKEVVLALGCEIVEEQKALHHIVFKYIKTQISIELHTMLAEPFDNERMNKYIDSLLDDCTNHTEYVESFGVRIPALIGAYHAYELITHMLQHFLRAGFGLKLLCDWVVFWNSETFSEEEEELYIKLVRESEIKGFSDLITLLCIDYLGLSAEKVEFMKLSQSAKHMDTNGMLQDIFEGEEFGHADKNRMVALRGDSIWDYVLEFHHQMKLNHPKASKAVVLWPALWIITYVVFIRNNRVLRKVDTKEIYRKAARRGKLVKQMHLFDGN